MSLDKLRAAYDYCEQVIKENSHTFYKAFAFLPEQEKHAVWAIYAFCRKVDDIIDEGDEPEQELVQFEQEFQQFLAGDLKEDDPIWFALADVFLHFEMDPKPFVEMIQGQKMDLSFEHFETMGELLNYSYHVASTVGLMLLPVLAPGKSERLRDGAIKLGLAMQLTNILRDIGEDLVKGRVYIPKELFEIHYYTQREFLHYEVNERFIAMWEEIARLAEHYYQEALATVNEYPTYSRTPVLGAAYLYRAILNEIRRNHYNVFQKRNYVTHEMKEKILADL